MNNNKTPQGYKKMKQKIETRAPIFRALYNEIAANREILKRVDETAAFDTPESLADLRSVIEQLKVKNSAIILLSVETIKEGTLYYALSQALSGFFLLDTIVSMDNSTIISDDMKPLLKKIRPQKYLSIIKENIEQIYNTLTISNDT
jgi:hypothetical protein